MTVTIRALSVAGTLRALCEVVMVLREATVLEADHIMMSTVLQDLVHKTGTMAKAVIARKVDMSPETVVDTEIAITVEA